MPWMIPTYEEADAMMAGPGGEAIFELARANGIVPLAFGESGYRQITNSVRPITEPADLDGIKIRVPGIKMFVDLFDVLGANPTTMNFAEVFTSLQQGTIDGQENPTDIIKSSKLEEVQEYLTVWNYVYDVLLLNASTKTWDMLTDEEKVIFQDAAIEALDYQKAQNRAKDEENLAYLEETMEVYTLSDETIAEFKTLSQPVYDSYEEIIGMELLEIFGYEK
jgi:TRAP-type C4-dicarboxylate transport system substrate-binding protein